MQDELRRGVAQRAQRPLDDRRRGPRRRSPRRPSPRGSRTGSRLDAAADERPRPRAASASSEWRCIAGSCCVRQRSGRDEEREDDVVEVEARLAHERAQRRRVRREPAQARLPGKVATRALYAATGAQRADPSDRSRRAAWRLPRGTAVSPTSQAASTASRRHGRGVVERGGEEARRRARTGRAALTEPATGDDVRRHERDEDERAGRRATAASSAVRAVARERADEAPSAPSAAPASDEPDGHERQPRPRLAAADAADLDDDPERERERQPERERDHRGERDLRRDQLAERREPAGEPRRPRSRPARRRASRRRAAARATRPSASARRPAPAPRTPTCGRARAACTSAIGCAVARERVVGLAEREPGVADEGADRRTSRPGCGASPAAASSRRARARRTSRPRKLPFPPCWSRSTY